jgi:hypothetical protein
MSTSNKVRLSAFVVILAAILTVLWHFAFIGFCKGSNFCLILTLVIGAGSFDLIRYFEEYFTATPNKPRTKAKIIANIIVKALFIPTMLYTSATFSALDVVIKHPTFLYEFATFFTWFVLFKYSQNYIEKRFAKKASQN